MRMVWALVAALGVSGCVHHRASSELHALEGEHVRVETTQHETVPAIAEPGVDGVVFRDESGALVAPELISEISKIRRGRGALEGLAIGVLIGGATGAVLGYADGDDCPGTRCFFKLTAWDKAGIGALVFGTLGAAVGVLVGVVHGSADIYSYSYSPAPRIVPGGPPGSVAGMTVIW